MRTAAPDLVREVLRLYFRGLTVLQIAHDLQCNVHSVLGIMGSRHLSAKWRRGADLTPWTDCRINRTPSVEMLDPDWDAL